MLKRVTLLLCAALLVGVFAQAATTKAEPAARIEGTIQSVDMAKHTITVQVGTEAKTFSLTSKTSYMTDGKKSKVTDLKAGQNVSIDADSKNVVRSIDVKAQQ